MMKSHRFPPRQLPVLLLLTLLLASSSIVRTESFFGAIGAHRPFRLGNKGIAKSHSSHKHHHQHLFSLRAGSSVPNDDNENDDIDLDTAKDTDMETDSAVTNTAKTEPAETETEPVVPQEDHPEEGVFIVMDGFCPYHGGYIAQMAETVEGVTVLPILSDYLWNYLQTVDPNTEYPRIPQSEKEWESLRSYLKGKAVIGVYCESDSGLADAEIVREKLQVLCRDDPDISTARRNKYLMNQVVAQAGLRTAQQKLCTSVGEAREFARELMKKPNVTATIPATEEAKDVNATSTATTKTASKPPKSAKRRVVVKPVRGVASESVYLCSNVREVKEACRNILGAPVFGEKAVHETVLVQEFLAGGEYAVDVVSRNGQHKVAAVWRYDKRPANGASFCYFQTELVDCDTDPNVQAVCDYAVSALKALGVQYGLSHNEMIVTDEGPTLVEVNCRQHNMDFCPLTMTCIGYNALDMTLEAFLGSDEDWDKFPDLPFLRAHGSMVHLVNTKQGKLKDLQHLQELHDLPSVMNWQIYEHFGERGRAIEPTIDIRTDAGWVQLANEDPVALQRDYQQILAWMPTMFLVEEDEIEEEEDEGTEMKVNAEDTETAAVEETETAAVDAPDKKDVQVKEQVKKAKTKVSEKEAELAVPGKSKGSTSPPSF
jgi:biotin carboxylase